MLTNNIDKIFLMLVLLNYFKSFEEADFFKIDVMFKDKGRLLEGDLFTSGKLFPP